MAIPIIFLHRTDDQYLSFVLSQAKWANPQSEVVLIGDPSNRKYAINGIKHALIRDYFSGAEDFSNVYQHVSPCEYYYMLFCFQRWFVLRDYMRSRQLQECWVIDSDIMVYADLNREDFKQFANEITVTSYTRLPELEELCALTQDHFADPQKFEYLKQYTSHMRQFDESGQLAVSDMVTQLLYYDTAVKGVKCHGFFGDSLFDISLSFSFPGVEMLDNKKKVYMIDGVLYFKRADSGQFIRVNSIHFTTGENKKYIPYFYVSSISRIMKGAYTFNYRSCKWDPVPV